MSTKKLSKVSTRTSRGQAFAEVFVQALKALPRGEQEQVILLIAENADLSQDLQDSLLIASRRHERTSSYEAYRSQRNSSRRKTG